MTDNLTIYYCRLSNDYTIGSANEQKIRALAFAAHKTVNFCSLNEFKGHLINRDWDGNYPVNHPAQLDYNHGYH